MLVSVFGEKSCNAGVDFFLSVRKVAIFQMQFKSGLLSELPNSVIWWGTRPKQSCPLYLGIIYPAEKFMEFTKTDRVTMIQYTIRHCVNNVCSKTIFYRTDSSSFYV